MSNVLVQDSRYDCCPEDKLQETTRNKTNNHRSQITSTSTSISSDNTNENMILVDWEGTLDPKNPRNWTTSFKMWITLVVWINAFSLEWAASANSQANRKISQQLHVSQTIESLSPALYVMGIGTGAIFAGPITETVGRKPVYVYSRILHVMSIFGASIASNIGMQLSCRFSAGLGASAIIAIHATSIVDVFGRHERSIILPFIVAASFVGTTLAPVVGGWIAQSHTTSWRWTDWIALIQSVTVLFITVLFMPETFAPIILKRKAEALRKDKTNQHYMADIELQRSFKIRLKKKLYRTWLMTTREYIVILLGLWLVIVFGIIFGFLQGFQYIFQKTYDFSIGQVGSCFAAITLGVALNVGLAPLFYWYHKHRVTAWTDQHGRLSPSPPEFRLVSAFVPAIAFPIGIFWLGWSNNSLISAWSDIGAATLCGFAWAGIFTSIYQYILDIYGIYAGTALSSIALIRYYVAGGMVIASEPLYRNMGVHWTMTLLGCLSGALSLAPFIFFIWGSRIRASSCFANTEMYGTKAAESTNQT